MPKIQINTPYTRAQLQELIGQAEADELKLQGYVLQFDALSSTYRVVPWHQASQPFRADGNAQQRKRVQATSDQFGELPPIIKRSAQSRVDSLTARWLVEMKKAGGLPSLQSGVAPEGSTLKEREDFQRKMAEERKILDAKIKEIVGAAWVEGRTEITSDLVRQVASHFLGVADTTHKAKLDKQVTRHED